MPRYSRRRDADRADDLPPPKLTRQALRELGELLAYLLPYWRKFVAALVALFCSSLLALTFPYIAGNLVDSALNHQPSEPGAFWRGDINQVALALILLLACQAAFSFCQSLWFAEVGERTLAALRRDCYARLICLPMGFYSQRRVGELTSRIASDLATMQDTLIGSLPHLLRQVTILSGGVGLIALTSWKLTLVMLASLPVLIAVAAFFGRKIRKAARGAQDRLADTNVILEETLQGIVNVKAFVNEGYELGRYHRGLQEFVTTALRGARFRAAFVSFIVFALFGAIVLVLWVGAGMVERHTLTAGQLTRFLLYTMFVSGAMGSFAELYSQFQRTLGASQRVREILHETPEVPALPPPDGAAQARPRLRGDVVFDRVTFRYPSRPEIQVLKDVTLSTRAGERIALVGPSGAGKSTIVALLLRFYDPEGGRILIDGRDAREYAREDLRGQMAVVPQEVLLFGGTVAENIAYGRPGASQAEIEDAARKANAHAFISGFPEGYETRVGERGIQLSGGQRQRVAIARAILKDPAILLLDEATSSLDSESESLVQEALETLMHGRTSLIIAHRLATVRTADRIFVIKEGETVESGTHAELVGRANGVYRNLSDLQFDLH
jgi:ATP-binding cassette subfamily B protein